MKITLSKAIIKNIECLIPDDEESAEALKKFDEFDLLQIDVGKIRVPGYHRKYFKMLAIAYENKPEKFNGYDKDSFREFVQIRAGYFEEFYDVINGQKWIKAKSIAFAKLPQDEFEQVFSNVADVILNTIFAMDRNMQTLILEFT